MKEVRCDVCCKVAQTGGDGRFYYTIVLREYRYESPDSRTSRFTPYQMEVCDKCFISMFGDKAKVWEHKNWKADYEMERRVYSKHKRLTKEGTSKTGGDLGIKSLRL